MHKVFVSHSSKDRRFVQSDLLPLLKENGVSPWYSHEDIQTADEWGRKLVRGLNDCEWFLVVMSPNSVGFDWVRAEVHWAVEQRNGRIVAFLLAACNPADLHLRLLSIHYVDFRHGRDGACRELLTRCEDTPHSADSPPPLGPSRGDGDSGEPDYSGDDERLWLKFRSEGGHATWQQLWEVTAFPEWIRDRRDIEEGMELSAICNTHGTESMALSRTSASNMNPANKTQETNCRPTPPLNAE